MNLVNMSQLLQLTIISPIQSIGILSLNGCIESTSMSF